MPAGEAQPHRDQQAEAQDRGRQDQARAQRPRAPAVQHRIERCQHRDRGRDARQGPIRQDLLVRDEGRAGRILPEPIDDPGEVRFQLIGGVRRPRRQSGAVGGQQADRGAGGKPGLPVELLEVVAMHGDHGHGLERALLVEQGPADGEAADAADGAGLGRPDEQLAPTVPVRLEIVTLGAGDRLRRPGPGVQQVRPAPVEDPRRADLGAALDRSAQALERLPAGAGLAQVARSPDLRHQAQDMLARLEGPLGVLLQQTRGGRGLLLHVAQRRRLVLGDRVGPEAGAGDGERAKGGQPNLALHALSLPGHFGTAPRSGQAHRASTPRPGRRVAAPGARSVRARRQRAPRCRSSAAAWCRAPGGRHG
ncbi:MAG: hypothetical protein K0S35_3655 [Geminicoccaceae bacterium]|nr:hypothetical protein [Geminicoccaceae bacterium]